ncbi:MAG: substrate-binding periplasmic protein [Halodesulfovibrio sp.]
MKTLLCALIAACTIATGIGITRVPALAMEVCISGRVPYEYVTESGYAGVSLELFATILEQMKDKKLVLSQVPWSRGLRALEEGTCDVLLSGVWDTEREKQFAYPVQPIGSIAWQFFGNKPDVELSGMWGGVRGFSYPKALYEQVSGLRRDVDAPTQESMVRKLMSGRVSVIAIELGSAQTLARELGITLYPVGKRVYVPLFALFNKNVPQSVIDRFDEVMERLWQEGAVAGVYGKYGLSIPRLSSRDMLVVDERFPPVTP